ncbi:MAG: hypothetical protein KGY43_08580, partial [Halodesulfurarchaeum sp.]|nr:hypothetical protein [Halodesulfurarchaeum sp.]
MVRLPVAGNTWEISDPAGEKSDRTGLATDRLDRLEETSQEAVAADSEEGWPPGPLHPWVSDQSIRPFEPSLDHEPTETSVGSIVGGAGGSQPTST